MTNKKEDSKIKIINQKEERLYSFILELRCPYCRKYFGLNIKRAETRKLMGDEKDSIDPCKTKAMFLKTERTTFRSGAEDTDITIYSFILQIRCPHCIKDLGLDVSNADVVTDY